MRRLVLVLSVLIAWGVLAGKRGRRAVAQPYPFPTRDAHERIVLEGPELVRAWCEKLSCSEHDLRAAMAKAGSSEAAVRYHLALDA
jgi:hypothetical protein